MNLFHRELKKSINKTKILVDSLNSHISLNGNNENDENMTKLTGEIRTNLRSINWDIQDLEETISKPQ
jgi:hypothetical protein